MLRHASTVWSTLETINNDSLDLLELSTLEALVDQAKGGNATAASQALLAIQRIRDKGAVQLHRAAMADAAKDSVAMAGYLASLGLDAEETARRLGRATLTVKERASWERAQDDRLLEVRAVEAQRMRVTGDVPKWATRRHA